MTSKNRWVAPLAGVAILMVSVAVGFASAQNTNGAQGPFNGRGRGGGPGGGAMGLLPMLGRLELSDTQRDTIKSIAQSHSEEWKGLFDRERKAREAVQAAVSADSFDEAGVRQRVLELSTVEADVAVARARARQEVLQVLNADQKARLKTFESSRPEGRGRRGAKA